MKKLFIIPLLVLCGCANTQIIQNSHVSGVKTSAGIPIPFSGGQSFLTVSLAAGDIKDNVIVQPTSTNTLNVGAVTIAQNTYSTAGVNGNAGTNNSAGIATLQHDQNIISTTGSVNSTNGSVNITH